ncbi:MAG: thioredoxin family protein [Betaproteobacteria bacterium]|nr:thioredoxin family protein [Betaproteobacteria bacterium]
MSILVEVFSTPGCGKCARARDPLKSVAGKFGHDKVIWREVNILEEMDYAVALGIMSPPAIAIDGQLVFSALPGVDRFRRELIRRLGRRG